MPTTINLVPSQYTITLTMSHNAANKNLAGKGSVNCSFPNELKSTAKVAAPQKNMTITGTIIFEIKVIFDDNCRFI